MNPSPRTPTTSLVLASGSPRRIDLLRSIGWDPVVEVADVDESVRGAESPTDYVVRVALAKAHAVADRKSVTQSTVVVAADTTVELDGVIFGKPVDSDDAMRILTALSGREHRVHTGMSVGAPGAEHTTVVTTGVVFGDLGRPEIERYLAFGESMDVAGAYAIQGAGGMLIERIDGSASNVVGLPLREADHLIRSALGYAPINPDT